MLPELIAEQVKEIPAVTAVAAHVPLAEKPASLNIPLAEKELVHSEATAADKAAPIAVKLEKPVTSEAQVVVLRSGAPKKLRELPAPAPRAVKARRPETTSIQGTEEVIVNVRRPLEAASRQAPSRQEVLSEARAQQDEAGETAWLEPSGDSYKSVQSVEIVPAGAEMTLTEDFGIPPEEIVHAISAEPVASEAAGQIELAADGIAATELLSTSALVVRLTEALTDRENPNLIEAAELSAIVAAIVPAEVSGALTEYLEVVDNETAAELGQFIVVFARTAERLHELYATERDNGEEAAAIEVLLTEWFEELLVRLELPVDATFSRQLLQAIINNSPLSMQPELQLPEDEGTHEHKFGLPASVYALSDNLQQKLQFGKLAKFIILASVA